MIFFFFRTWIATRIAHCLRLYNFWSQKRMQISKLHLIVACSVMLISHFNVARIWNFQIKQTVFAYCRDFERSLWCERKTDDLKSVVERIVEEIATHSSCVVFITDSVYRGLTDMHAIEISSSLSIYDVSILKYSIGSLKKMNKIYR